jgi:HEPN domain-containing protein
MDKYYNISSWKSMAEDDLSVAKREDISLFIRAYHAQQTIEKMLKAAFVVSAGTFDKLNNGWVLPKNVKFPMIHDLSCLWGKIIDLGVNDFPTLNAEQKELLDSISRCAAEYRYPYYLKRVGSQVAFPEIDIKLVLECATTLFGDLYDYVCKSSS